LSVTREKLYEEIWAEPITKVAKRYGVSDSFLVRILQRLNVPRPPMGYWAKLAVGKTVPRPVLPEARPGDELEWSREGQPTRVPRALPKPPDSPRPSRIRKKTDRPARHSLVTGARAHFEDVRETDAGYLKPAKKLLIDLIVSKGVLDRALDVANEFFLLLEDHGHQVVLAPRDRNFRRAPFEEREEGGAGNHYPGLWQPYAPTVVFIGTVAIGLTLFETSQQVEMRWVNGKYVPVDQLPLVKRKSLSDFNSWTTKRDIASGRLCLQAYSPYPGTEWKQQWSATKAGDLQSKLKTIARELAQAAPDVARQVEEAERQAEIWRQQREREHQAWLHEQEERRRVQAIKESRADLFAIIEAWNEAVRIEGFFSEVEQCAAELNEENRQEILGRLKAARDQLGSEDVLQRFLAWKTAEERFKV